jgi:hypothetical protein
MLVPFLVHGFLSSNSESTYDVTGAWARTSVDPPCKMIYQVCMADHLVAVHQVVRDKSGKLLVDQIIQHVFEIRDGLIRNMEIRP